MKTREELSSGVSNAIRTTVGENRRSNALIVKSEKSEFSVKLAQTLEEREAVFRLAYQVYFEKGFIKKNSREMLIREYDFDDATAILMVKDHSNNIVGSVTLVFDGESYLPAQTLYGEEILNLRRSGEKTVEISRLIIDPKFRNSKEILLLMINYLFIFASYVRNFTYLAIEVNPRHKNYYQELLGFHQVGGEKPCPSVENAPALLLCLPLCHYKKELTRCERLVGLNKKERTLYQQFIRPEQEDLVIYYLSRQIQPMTGEEKEYFGFSNVEQNEKVCL